MLYDWRSLPAPYRRRIVELKDRYDALWQATLDALHAEGRLGADARIARLMILGAINFSATWYRARPRGRAGVDLDTLAPRRAPSSCARPRHDDDRSHRPAKTARSGS